MTERQLTDRQVEAGLKSLIHELRSGSVQPAEQRDVVDVEPGAETDLLNWNIRRNWDDLFATQPRHKGKSEKLHPFYTWWKNRKR